MHRMDRYFWVKIDLYTDEILAVADTQKELAELCGVKESSIRESICRANKRGWRCCYLRMDVDD